MRRFEIVTANNVTHICTPVEGWPKSSQNLISENKSKSSVMNWFKGDYVIPQIAYSLLGPLWVPIPFPAVLLPPPPQPLRHPKSSTTAPRHISLVHHLPLLLLFAPCTPRSSANYPSCRFLQHINPRLGLVILSSQTPTTGPLFTLNSTSYKSNNNGRWCCRCWRFRCSSSCS